MPLSPNFISYNSIILGFLLVLFTFVDNILNQESTTQRSKKGSKRRKIGHLAMGNCWLHDGCCHQTVAAGSRWRRGMARQQLAGRGWGQPSSPWLHVLFCFSRL